MSKKSNVIIAQELCNSYISAIERFASNISNSFDQAVKLILSCSGHVVVCGMGKSGHIGRKISATLASTGSPSFFLHPAEAIHGDLGMVKKNDVLLLISYSGETEEIIKLLNPFKNLDVKIIALTSKNNSTLSKSSDISLDVSIDREACPLNLAPTTSSMLTMSAGDALAIATMQARGFAEEDFALTHPGGSLGKDLTELVKDKMVSKNLPLINKESTMAEVIIEMTKSRLGLAVVCDDEKLIGIITDGDLRRLLLKDKDINLIKAKEVMSENPLTINKNTLMLEAKKKMQEFKVQALVVLNSDNKVEGVIQIF